MWTIAVDDSGDGTRLFKPRPGSREALKWLIEELCGATADLGRTTRANNALRQQAHRALVDTGLADRINQVSFRLLILPADLARADPEDRQLSTSDVTGEVAVDGVSISDVPANDVSTERDSLRLAGLAWSSWHPLDVAASEASTRPGSMPRAATVRSSTSAWRVSAEASACADDCRFTGEAVARCPGSARLLSTERWPIPRG